MRLVFHLQPKFEDASLEERHLSEREVRSLSVLRTVVTVYLFIALLWLAMPRAGMALSAWLFYRVNTFCSALSLLYFLVGYYRRWVSFKKYDWHIFVLGCHFLAFQSFDRCCVEGLLGLPTSPAVHDEAYQLLVCMTFWAGFLAYAEVDLRLHLAMIHFNLAVWVGLRMAFDTNMPLGLLIKLT
ncbi:unnamed protein product, partial [Polarella glacialis]